MKRRAATKDKLNRDELLSSKRKRQTLGILLEELSREVDIPLISKHTSLMMTQMQNQRVAMIPKILEVIEQQNEPLVFEISRKAVPVQEVKVPEEVVVEEYVQHPYELYQTSDVDNAVSVVEGIDYSALSQHIELTSVEESNELINYVEGSGAEEKQFEIIFADSTRPSEDVESEHLIIHSRAERSATSVPSGTVNVPKSFPLFQLVHTGEVSEEMQREIEQKIRKANPQLDLNSITFKFTPPETVEIIANVNT